MKQSDVLGFDHVAFNVTSIERSVEWYKDSLGCDVLYQDATGAMLNLKDAKIALTLADHPSHIAFRISSEANLSGSGGEIKKHRDGSSYVYASDPDGNTIEWLVYTDEPE